MKPSEIVSIASKTPEAKDMPGEYRPLHKYLEDRYADTVVLRFAEIEGLIGFALPDLARQRQDWWGNADGDGEPSLSRGRGFALQDRQGQPHRSDRRIRARRTADDPLVGGRNARLRSTRATADELVAGVLSGTPTRRAHC